MHGEGRRIAINGRNDQVVLRLFVPDGLVAAAAVPASFLTDDQMVFCAARKVPAQ